MQNRIALQRHRLAVPHLTLARTTTNLKHRANQAARRAQYGRPSCACLNQAIRTAWQEPRRFGLPVLVGEKSEPAPVASCPVQSSPAHAEAAHVVDQQTYLQLPSLPPSVVRASLLSNDGLLAPNRRNATRPNHYRLSQPNPTQPVPSQSHPNPNPKLARLVPRPRSASSPGLRPPESRQVGASLEIQRSSSRQTQDRSRPGRQTTSSQYLPTCASTLPPTKSARPLGSGQTHELLVSATHRALPRQSLPACLSCLPACPPARTTSLCSLHTPNKVHLLILSYPALPCPALILHRISARYTPRRAAPPACLPYLSRAPRYTHSLTVPPSMGSHHAVALVLPTPALNWTLPRVPVSPLPPTLRPSSLRTACITRPGLP